MSKAASTLPAPSARKLVALTAGQLSIPAPKEGEERQLPGRLLAMPWGTTKTNKGTLTVNELTLSVLPRNQATAKFDRIAFDFNHNTVDAKPGDEPLKVAGWGIPEIVAGEGIYLSAIEYTDEGRAALLGGHYPDLSPTLHVNDAGEVVFIHSLAAARQGEVDGLTLFAPVAGSKAAAALTALSAEGLYGDAGATDWRAIAVAALNALGADLDADAEGSDILAAAATLRRRLSPDSETNPDPDMTEDLKTLAARVETLEKGGADSRRQIILSAAKAAGKVIPLSAETIAATAPETLEEIVRNLPAGQVPLSSDIPGNAEEPGESGELSAVELEVCRQVGLTADEYKKFGARI